MIQRNVFHGVLTILCAYALNACSNATINSTEENNTVGGTTPNTVVVQEPLIDVNQSFDQNEVDNLCQDLSNYSGGEHPDSVSPSNTAPLNANFANAKFNIKLLSGYAILNSVYVEIRINKTSSAGEFFHLDPGYKILVNGQQLQYSENGSVLGYYHEYVDLRPTQGKANVCIIDNQGNAQLQQIRMPQAVSIVNYRNNETSPTFEESVDIEFSPAFKEVRGNICVVQCILSYQTLPSSPGVMSFNRDTLRADQMQEALNIQANPDQNIRRLSYSFQNQLESNLPILNFAESEIQASVKVGLYLYYPYIP